MFPSFLLALREGLEIALIVGIVLGVLNKLGRKDLIQSVRIGVVAAVGLSLVIAVMLNMLGASFTGASEAIFEGIMMWTAAIFLTWMILWMQSRAARIKQEIQSEVSLATRAGKTALFLLAFVAVLREGIELALFLTASVFTTSVSQTLAGASLGLAAATMIGVGLFRASIKLDLGSFFRVTSVLLILFAAGLVAHGTHEFNEIGLIPGLIEPVWDTNAILDENSVVGQILKTLFGYNGNPSLSEVLSYAAYFGVLFLATRPKVALAPVRGEAT
jgi:high-affinity iron transporter